MISFGQGLVNCKGVYYNPDKIAMFYADNPNRTVIRGKFGSCFGGDEAEWPTRECCDVQKFAEAFVKAQQTGQIVDCKA